MFYQRDKSNKNQYKLQIYIIKNHFCPKGKKLIIFYLRYLMYALFVTVQLQTLALVKSKDKLDISLFSGCESCVNAYIQLFI